MFNTSLYKKQELYIGLNLLLLLLQVSSLSTHLAILSLKYRALEKKSVIKIIISANTQLFDLDFIKSTW